MAHHEDADVGFEEGFPWLPAHILHEACGDHHFYQEQVGQRGRHHQNHYHVKAIESHPLPPQWRSVRKYNNRGRYGNNTNSQSQRVTGGPGMQAVFLEPVPAQKSCGTGVFLPRAACADFQPTKKPACSPVLLPSRVVQALNINVQSLGLQISPRQDQKPNQKQKVDNHNQICRKENEDVRVEHFHVISQDRSSSPEIFLPKEWSY